MIYPLVDMLLFHIRFFKLYVSVGFPSTLKGGVPTHRYCIEVITKKKNKKKKEKNC